MKKHELFYKCVHNYQLGEAGLVVWTDIANIDITDRGLAGRRRQSRLVGYIMNMHMKRIFNKFKDSGIGIAPVTFEIFFKLSFYWSNSK